MSKIDPCRLRRDFTVLDRENPPIYLDNACMTLKPKQVVDAMTTYYDEYPVCEGRSAHAMAMRLEHDMLASRRAIRDYIKANHVNEIVFTRNTSESISIVSYGIDWKPGDVVLVSDKEHNSNFVPWFRLKEWGVKVVVVPSGDDGRFSVDNWARAVKESKPKLISFYHTSNLDGETSRVAEVCKLGKEAGALVCLDAAQGAAHVPLNVQEIGCDFMAISIHKMCGPTGMGALYGKLEELRKLKPLTTGGGTVFSVTYDEVKLLDPPRKFEAGLQNYAGIVGVKPAVDYIESIGLSNIHEHEIELNQHLQNLLEGIPQIKILGPKDAKDRGGITSMTVEGYNVHDLAMLLDDRVGIMLRAGFHCVHGWFNSRGIDGTLRVSTYLYNTKEEMEIFASAIKEVIAEE